MLDDEGTLTVSGTGAIKNSALQETNAVHIVIGEGITEIGKYAFSYNSKVTSVSLPDSLTTIGAHAFISCRAIETVEIPAGVTDIGAGAFGSTSKLTSINVAAGNPSFVSVDGVLFDKAMTTLLACPGKKSGEYTVPEGVVVIGREAFLECESITALNLPASLTTLEESAIAQCYNLATVTIPAGVTSIGTEAFQYSNNVSDVYYGGTIADWKQIAVGENNDILRKIIIDCADGDLDLRYSCGEDAT